MTQNIPVDTSALVDGEILDAADLITPFNQLKAAIENTLNGIQAITQLLLDDGGELTIVSGAITLTDMYHNIDTESDAASDDLDTINGLSVGKLAFLRVNDGARDVVLTHNVGNVLTVTGSSITLDDTTKMVLVFHNGTNVVAMELGAGGAPTNAQYLTLATDVTLTDERVLVAGNELVLADGGAGSNATLDVNIGTEVIKTISTDVAATGSDRNLIIAAESGTSDDLIEITGLTIGERCWIRADAGDIITVKHNDAGATIKIHLYGNADLALDELNPLELILVATNVLAQPIDLSIAGSGISKVVATGNFNPSGAFNTSSNTFVDVDATNVKITIILNGNGITHVTFTFAAFKLIAGSMFVRLTDGTNNSEEFEINLGQGIQGITLSHVYDGLTSGSTTFKLQFRSDDANNAGISITTIKFFASEIS